ncbi:MULTISPECIES: hypothetical protein [unclassified Bradyrhizobium]
MKREVIRVEPMSSWLANRNAPVSPVTRGRFEVVGEKFGLRVTAI